MGEWSRKQMVQNGDRSCIYIYIYKYIDVQGQDWSISKVKVGLQRGIWEDIEWLKVWAEVLGTKEQIDLELR